MRIASMGEAEEQTVAQERIKAAEYIADLTEDLARMARQHKFHTLGYLLEMARLEAQTLAGRSKSPDGSGVS